MLKKGLVILIASIITFAISSFVFAETATELPEFKDWPVYKELPCKEQFDFKMEEWQSDKNGTQKIARITQKSTDITFILFEQQEQNGKEGYFYKNGKQLKDRDFFEELFKATGSNEETFLMIMTACTGQFNIM
ncbi:MAG: hypothetical protein HYT28_02520 [Parcubacteria group bacterium]|nr:hypothetical protein [Parcubacteria group bacterium]